MKTVENFIHSGVQLGFVYVFEHIGVDGKIKSIERVENIIPDAGRDYLLNAGFNGGAQFAQFYIGLYINARTPLAGDTMTEFAADYGESVSYDGAVRLTLTPDVLAAGLWSNIGTPAEFDFNTGAEVVRGGIITSSNTRGGSTGLLLSAVLSPTPKSMIIGETLRVKSGIQFITA